MKTALTRRECRASRMQAGGAYARDGGIEVEFKCECGSTGYTDGWGALHFSCGGVYLAVDGEPVNPCRKLETPGK